jgi:hypothetical protein
MKKEKNKYIFDTGVSENGVVYNADVIIGVVLQGYLSKYLFL